MQKMKTLRSNLNQEEDRLSKLKSELMKESESFKEEKSRFLQMKKEVELSKVDFENTKDERESEYNLKAKLLKVEMEDRFTKERHKLNESLNNLKREKELLEKEMKAKEKKESQKYELEADKSVKEANLMKVDLRIANKQVKEHKDTITYLRQMYREERDTARKLEEETNTLKTQIEKNELEMEGLKRELSEAKESQEKVNTLKEDLSKKSSEAKGLSFRLAKAESDCERLTSRLDKAEKEVIKYRESQTQLNIYKVACLELEDQTKEFETVIEKLETQKEKLTSQLAESKGQYQDIESTTTQLKIEINDLKSKLIFANSQLKESNSKLDEIESLYKSEETKLRLRLNELTASKEQHLVTISDLKYQMEDLLTKCSNLSGEENSKTIALNDLKESYSNLLTRFHELTDKNNVLITTNENIRIRLARAEDGIQDEKEETSQILSNHKKTKHELITKINQLEKLIDYLQTKLNKRVKCKGVFCHQKYSDKENMNVALPYEALKDKLKIEENKNRQLLKDLNSVRGELRSTHTKDNANIFLPTPNDQRANHSIPHRWTTQTNMKVTKCSTCFGDVHFCRQASVCQYCHRTVHIHCVDKSSDDCGLPKTLAPVLKNSSGKKEKPFEGYLKIPEQGGKYWMSVHVKIVDDQLIIKGEGMETKKIDLMPSNGFVYIQSSVVYTELLHTTAYDQPHVFKIGYNNSKSTHYFMAKSFTDKAMWIKEIENISLRMKYEDKVNHSDSDSNEDEDVSRCEIACLDPSYNVYCVAPMKDSWLLGTSSGFLFVHSGVVTPVERSPSTVYQMEIVLSINKIVLITGHDRKLGILNMDRIHSRDFNPINLTTVKSCHLFGVGSVEKDVYLCAVDDCRVSIFKYDEGFTMVHKFSTDNPTSCLQFTSSSVLVITDKIYDIDLDDFAVEEFLDLDESPMTLSNNYPIAMYQINNNEFLLCFQERGIFVNSSGNKSRQDIKWNSISGQFAYSRGKLWVTYYNAVEVFDLSIKEQKTSTSKMMLSKNPQILNGQGHVYLLEERNRDLVLLELTKND
ncbi:citron Rho-interacting kinase [Lepeophtheirus salmonis]|uniref:citron Rho-interacting kinase n=1 Tax=Lepeophtheirus salmonis TaxID=72036 RepID=UPI001AEA4955|nr:citron Rho-interacting kinase-like [Lepeophtheirus salmonis]